MTIINRITSLFSRDEPEPVSRREENARFARRVLGLPEKDDEGRRRMIESEREDRRKQELDRRMAEARRRDERLGTDSTADVWDGMGWDEEDLMN